MIYLYLWVVLAAERYNTYMGWVNAGAYDSQHACVVAAANLGLKDQSQFRCISRVTGDAK